MIPVEIQNLTGVAFSISVAFLVVNGLVLLCQLLFMRYYVNVLSVPVPILAPFVTRPISAPFLVLALVSVGVVARERLRERKE